MIKGIRHIIFDLGGVLLNIDYQLTEKAFQNLGVESFPEIYSQLRQTSLFDDFETGRIGKDAFFDQLRSIGNINCTDEQMTGAWNAMLLDFPKRRLQLLQQLRGGYDLLLLSNTNEVHEQAFNKILYQDHSINNIALFFDKVYYSHKVGMRKPDAEVFERVLGDNGLSAEHTLFIDDSPQHVEGARKVGIQSIWLEKGMTIETDIFKPKVN